MSAYAERRGGKLTGRWIGETVIGGDKFRKRFETKREAERWADYVKLTGSAPVGDPAAPSAPTFSAVARDMKTARGAVRDPSAGQRIEYAVASIGPTTPVTEVTTAMLDKLVADLKRRPGKKPGTKLSAGSVNRYLAAASSVLTFAKQRGYLPAIPVVPWQREEGQRFLWLTEDQEAAIAAQMDEGCALVLRVLIASGMRWGEFAALEVGQIEVRNENAWVRLWKTKTDSPRSIPIPVHMGRQLLEALASGGLPGYRTFRNHLKAALASAGQSPEFCVHSLRHTTATRLIQRGVGLPIVKKYLGHKALVTTLRYTQVADEDLAQAATKLSQHAGHSVENPLRVFEEA
jgi:integrase